MKGKYIKPLPSFLQRKNNEITYKEKENKSTVICNKCKLTYTPENNIQKRICIKCFNKL